MNIRSLLWAQQSQQTTNGMDSQSLPFADWKKYVFLFFQLGYSTQFHSISILFHTASEGSVRDIASVVMIGAEAASLIITTLSLGKSHGLPHSL
jgi:hypothetical protein